MPLEILYNILNLPVVGDVVADFVGDDIKSKLSTEEVSHLPKIISRAFKDALKTTEKNGQFPAGIAAAVLDVFKQKKKETIPYFLNVARQAGAGDIQQKLIAEFTADVDYYAAQPGAVALHPDVLKKYLEAALPEFDRLLQQRISEKQALYIILQNLGVLQQQAVKPPAPAAPAPPPHELNFLPLLQNPEKEAIGREPDIEELHRLLVASPLVAVVRGIGGMGKTTLARAYLTRYKDEYDHVAWLSGADKLLTACANATLLHQRLGLHFTDEPEEQRFLQTMTALHRLPGHNLLVLDNAAATLTGEQLAGKPLHEYLPGSHWKKLATSRERIARFKEFELQKLPHDAALALFKEHYGAADEAELKNLFVTVGYHTLTIEILAKTLRASKGELPLSRLTASLGQHRLDDDALQHRIEVDHPGNDAGVFLHLLDTFAEAGVTPGSTAYRVLQHFLLLPPEGLTEGLGHPFSFLKEALVPHAAAEVKHLSESLDHLADLGWLTAEQDNHFSLHRLLKEVLLYKMKPAAEEVEGFIEYIAGLFYADERTDYSKLLPMLHFEEAVLEVMKNHVDEAIARLLNNAGDVNRMLGKYDRALELLESSLAMAKALWDENHAEVAVRQSNLAIVYRNLGQYEKAAALQEAALDSAEKNFGKDHPVVSVRQSNLGEVYRNLGRYEEAAALLEAALDSDLKNFGKDHPSVAIRQSNLATVYRNLGRYEEAAALLEAALDSALKNLGKDHPTVAVSQSNLATVYGDLGRYKEAAALLEAALDSDLKNFGKDHPTVATRLNNLAFVFANRQQWAEALPLFEQAYGIFLKAFGEEHPHTKIALEGLTYVQEQLNQSPS